MSKNKVVFICDNCGYETLKWLGQCPSCHEWNTIIETKVFAAETKAQKLSLIDNQKPIELKDIKLDTQSRISTGFREFDNLLGGGMLPDQVILLAGEPGIGKSTLLLQLGVKLASGDKKAVYVSAEESSGQIGNRAHRLGIDKSNLVIVNSSDLEYIKDYLLESKSKIVIVDSIQTIYDPEVQGIAGSISQIRSCAAKLVSIAKSNNMTLIMVGHITKEGSIAGPKVLEHLVDTVLQFEGDELLGYRLVRSLKNRFGQVGEVGIFAMTELGLSDIGADQNIFIDSNSQDAIGIARTVIMDGNRPLLVEVQALVNRTVFTYPKRVSEGVLASRLQTLCAIVSKFSSCDLNSSDVYIKVTGGYKIQDPVADLAIVEAIKSSYTNTKVALDNVFVGEVTLAGKVLQVPHVSRRLAEAERYGVKGGTVGGTKGAKVSGFKGSYTFSSKI